MMIKKFQKRLIYLKLATNHSARNGLVWNRPNLVCMPLFNVSYVTAMQACKVHVQDRFLSLSDFLTPVHYRVWRDQENIGKF